MAKWYRSIRIVETEEALGAWLERHGITVVTGKTRKSRKQQLFNGMSANNASGHANTPPPIFVNPSCAVLLGDNANVANHGGVSVVTTAAVKPLESPSHPTNNGPNVEAGLSVHRQDVWPGLSSFASRPVRRKPQPRKLEVPAAAGGATFPQPRLAASCGWEADGVLSPTSEALASSSTAVEAAAAASSAADIATAVAIYAALSTLVGLVASSSEVSVVHPSYKSVETLTNRTVAPGVYAIGSRAALSCLAAMAMPRRQECPLPSTFKVQPPQFLTAQGDLHPQQFIISSDGEGFTRGMPVCDSSTVPARPSISDGACVPPPKMNFTPQALGSSCCLPSTSSWESVPATVSSQ